MIKKITMNQIACYKNSTVLETNKKVNLAYGLNGTGKSTISNYLYDRVDSKYAHCAIEGLTDEDILVYNQRFINENFYESDTLRGIFTLSKENKAVEELIKKTEKEIQDLEAAQKKQNSLDVETNSELSRKKQKAEEVVWNIKQQYTGGDRVLEYCLKGLQGRKDTLFEYILTIQCPIAQPIKTLEMLKKEATALNSTTAQKYNELPLISFSESEIELNPLFQKTIVGNENSTIAELIKTLGNADWVKTGLDYLPHDGDDKTTPCPFCQEMTITAVLISKIKDYFDGTYTRNIDELKKLLAVYTASINAIPLLDFYAANPFIMDNKTDFDNQYNSVMQCVAQNKRAIEDKIKSPSQTVTLTNSTEVIKTFNAFIKDVNKEIVEHNAKLDNKESSLNEIKKAFWEIMRWDYNQTISNFTSEKKLIEIKREKIKGELSAIDINLIQKRKYITEQQKKTINIDEAVNIINAGLVDLGIDTFKIEKHSDVLNKITIKNDDSDTFKTLSEGEK